MAENHDEESAAATEHVIRIAIQTPHGTEEVAVNDVPDEVRNALIEGLRSGDMPEEVRIALSKALEVDLADLPDAAEVSVGEAPGADGDSATSYAATDDADKAPLDAHATGCDCAERHREHVWRILDAAFPQEPHLWKAMEALFEISSVNPHELNDEARRTALNEAALHIKRHTELTAPPLSPVEQMVEQFRKEMGII